MKGNKEKGSGAEDWRWNGYGRDCEGNMDRIARDDIRGKYPWGCWITLEIKKNIYIRILKRNDLKGGMRNDWRNAESNG